MRAVLEILVCLFAVFGLYALILRVLAFFTRRSALRVAVLLSEEMLASPELAALYDNEARLCAEGQRGRLGGPVLLLERHPTEEERAALLALGRALYIREPADPPED